MNNSNDNLSIESFGIPYWYPALSAHTFMTGFVKLKEEEIKALAAGESEGESVNGAVKRLALPMNSFSGNSFVFTDMAAPTDTVRFTAKRGAVYSPESAWNVLAKSEKIKKAAQDGLVKYICVRPFRRMNKMREFRLFIKGGKLVGMSQYWLEKHFKRLEKRKSEYWENACLFIDETSWLLPAENLAMDVYFTSENQVLVIDLNPWGGSTDALLFKDWDYDWGSEPLLKTIPPPFKISGEVNVSF
jgi:hypothetical protein